MIRALLRWLRSSTAIRLYFQWLNAHSRRRKAQAELSAAQKLVADLEGLPAGYEEFGATARMQRDYAERKLMERIDAEQGAALRFRARMGLPT